MKSAIFKSLFIASFVVIVMSAFLGWGGARYTPGTTFLGLFLGNLIYEIFKLKGKK